MSEQREIREIRVGDVYEYKEASGLVRRYRIVALPDRSIGKANYSVAIKSGCRNSLQKNGCRTFREDQVRSHSFLEHVPPPPKPSGTGARAGLFWRDKQTQRKAVAPRGAKEPSQHDYELHRRIQGGASKAELASEYSLTVSAVRRSVEKVDDWAALQRAIA